MSLRIQAPQVVVEVEAKGAPDAKGAKAKADAAKAGRDFEAILLRQMLGTSKVAGKGGYSDMAVESLATSITAAGGLGMGRALEDALSAHTAHTAAPPLPVRQPVSEGLEEKMTPSPQVPYGPAVVKRAE